VPIYRVSCKTCVFCLGFRRRVLMSLSVPTKSRAMRWSSNPMPPINRRQDAARLWVDTIDTQAFACYAANPQCFTFLTTADGDRIEIRAAEGCWFGSYSRGCLVPLSLSGIMHLLESSVAGESPAATPSHVRAWPGFVTKVTRPKLVIVPHVFQALRHLPLYLSGLCAGSICNLRTSPSGLTH
jgi:hypothetical protein